jgi:hypothetical protein
MRRATLWRLSVLLSGCALACGALDGCSKRSPTATPEVRAPAGPPPGSTLAVAGQMLTGDDPAAIRAYLQSVKEIKPTKFDVEWNPATVAIGRDEAIRSLRSISRNGSTFRLASSEPVVAKLKPGSILWIWDIAVRKVERIEIEDDVTVVYTRSVALTEALTRAQIEFEAPVSLADYYVGRKPRAQQEAAAPRTARAFRPSYFRLVGTNSEPPAPGPGPGPGPQTTPPDPGDDSNDDSEDDDAAWEAGTPLHGAHSGKVKGFDYSLAYTTRPKGVTLTLEAKKEDEDDSGKSTEQEGQDEIAKKFKELTTEAKEARKAEQEAQKQVDALQKDLHTLEAKYESDVAQAQADNAARGNPASTGPKPPPVPTDSNGFPLTLQGQIDQLTKYYNNQRNTELGKIQAELKVRAEAQKRKMDADEQRKKLAQLGGVAKKLYEIASDNLDVRFKAKVDMDNFAVAGALDLAGGNVRNAMAQFKQVNGTIAVSFIGRFGKPGNGAVKVPVVNIPIAFNIPFPIGGLPFVIQLGTDFLVNVFLAGNHAAMHFDGTYAFNGSGGVHATQTSTNADSTMTGGTPEVQDFAGMSPGVSGLVLGVQVPRLGFGFGVVGMSSVAYLDVVNVVTMTNSAAAAAGMLAPPCRRVSWTAVGHVGISTNIVPWPIPYVADKINDALSTKPKEIFKHEKVLLDPPIKACEI